MWKDITEKEKNDFNFLATHPLQTYEWGEFREKTGVKVIRKGFFEGKKLKQAIQLTIHKIPHTSWNIGYLPKGNMPNKEMIDELKNIGKENNCIFIQLEPNIEKYQMSNTKSQINTKNQITSNLKTENLIGNWKLEIGNCQLVKAAHPLFTRFTFVLDLTKTEADLLANMHHKTRYNIKVAKKHGITVKEESSEKAFEEYLKLTKETTNRQGFFAHTPNYHKLMWETLGNKKIKSDELSAHLFVAYYKNIALTTWILFVFKDVLYYPYGASSSEHRETMASNLMMWDVIKFGKKLGLKTFDMWGSLGENPNIKDPWYGFHRFKMGYSPKLVEFVGSYDLVINPILYQLYKIADKFRYLLLKK